MIVLAVSCTHNTATNTGVPSLPLIPLTAGNVWIYTDSIFNNQSGGTLDSVYTDSVVVNSQTADFSSQNGQIVFYGVTDPNGWFGNSYLGVDPTNTAAYGLDSLNGTPYTFFATSTVDQALLGQSTDYTDYPNCPETYSLYGYATTTTIGGHTCLQNIQTTVNCSNLLLEQINTYLAPGVGIVRIADYESDSTGANLNRSFSMTLQSYTLQ
jgi:hypothetical protein